MSKKSSKGKSGGHYAVASGRSTGVYDSWTQAEQQVSGYSNNQHQKFSSIQEAHAYVERNGGYSRPPGTNDTGKYYAVASGRSPGIYSSWDQAEPQVKGYAGAQHQRFSSPDQAQAYMDHYSNRG